MITRFNSRFIGIKLIRLFNLQVELWFGIPHSNIPWHAHTNISSTIVHLLGDMEFKTLSWVKHFGYFSFFRWNTISKNVLHAGRTGKYCGAFLNIEYWHDKAQMTSAAKDIVFTNTILH